jgi:hypothetical protein
MKKMKSKGLLPDVPEAADLMSLEGLGKSLDDEDEDDNDDDNNDEMEVYTVYVYIHVYVINICIYYI